MVNSLEFLKRNKEDMVETLLKLTRAESPSHSKDLVDQCGELLMTEFTTLVGGRMKVIEQEQVGNQYLFSVGPETSEKQVLVIGHLDTVWEKGTLPIRQEGDFLYGPGVFDMKGGLTITLWAFKALIDLQVHLDRQITLLVTTDEEIGSVYSKEIILEEATKSKVVFVPESSISPDGAVKTERKGAGQFTIHTHGIAAHAGINAWGGSSAIEEMAYQILDIKKLANQQEGISVNVGTISGGTRANVIPKEAVAEIDVRITKKDQAEKLTNALLARPTFVKGTSVTMTGEIERYPLERTEAVIQLYEELKEIASSHGYDLHEGSSGGASDGNFTAGIDIPTIDGLGPVGDGAHAENEHVDVRNLPYRAALLTEILLKYGQNERSEK